MAEPKCPYPGKEQNSFPDAANAPICKHFGKCGGCAAQHIDYAAQLDNKKKTVARELGVDEGMVQVFSGEPYGYRNRMDFVFHASGIGLREKGDWKKIVDVKRCEISNERLNELLGEVLDFFRDCDYFDIRKQTGAFRYAVIRTPHNDSSISFVLNKNSSKLREAVEKVKGFSSKTSAKNVIVTYVPAETDMSVSEDYFAVKGKEMLEEEYLGKKFTYHVQSFFQNNHEMAEKMLTYSRELLKKQETSRSHLLDLYGGVGSFGIINADLFKGVSIVESVKGAIDAANANILANGITNAKGIVQDAKNLERLNLPKGGELCVINDPPRSGMHPKAIQALNELVPKTIIYISCNVQQLGKELPKFKNHEIKSVAMFDLFPQTPHIEAVVELGLK